MLYTFESVRGSKARVPFASDCLEVFKEMKSFGNKVTVRPALHSSVTLLSSEDSHKDSYGIISLPLIIIWRFAGRRATSLRSRKGSPATTSPISSLVIRASRTKT